LGVSRCKKGIKNGYNRPKAQRADTKTKMRNRRMTRAEY